MKSSVMLGVWMLVATLLVAQPRSKNAQRHDGRLAEKMKTELALTDTQYASIETIDKKYAGKHQMLRRDSTLARVEKHAQQKTLKAEKKKEIDAVLTSGQKTKWAAHTSKEAEARKVRREEKRVKHAARLKAELGLTDEQQTKMDAAGKSFSEKAQGLRGKAKTKEDRRAEMERLKADHEATLKTILSDGQFKKWQELKAKHSHKGMHSRR